ncbi:unnamed protein product [Pleuronectes platessa]|uniref:Uncharacterized protein n=1 Tax=Pleuronectes platessa TaxID=8262 RepID=A0A9N7UPD5_PLEPL|nr:unnamed protein product [Pleuronectes platessa]
MLMDSLSVELVRAKKSQEPTDLLVLVLSGICFQTVLIVNEQENPSAAQILTEPGSVNSVQQLNAHRTRPPPKRPRTHSLLAMKTSSLNQQGDENLDGSFPDFFSSVDSVHLWLIRWSLRTSESSASD